MARLPSLADPVEWCRASFGDRPWSVQRDIMGACADHDRVAVKAGHGVGKSWLAARVGIHRWLTTPGALLVTTAPTYRQVNDVIWREIRRCDRASGHMMAPNRPLSKTPRWEADGTGRWVALGVSPENSDALQGYHESELIAIIDEAAGVEPWIWDAILALQPTLILAIGNPTDPDGEFAACWDSDRWQTFSIPCWDSPNLTGEWRDLWDQPHPALVNEAWIEEVEDRFGRDSAYYRSRVDAEFPDAGEASLIPLSWLESCQVNQVPEHIHTVLGVDVAEFGGDRTVVSVWRDLTLVDIVTLPPADLMETTGRIKQLAEGRYNAQLVAVDDTGLCGVSSRLREQGVNVLPIVPGSGAEDTERYVNLRSEMAWQLREDVRNGVLSICGDWPLFREECRKTQYAVTSAGKIQLERKDLIRERIGRSPDSLDAVMYGWQGVRTLRRGPARPLARRQRDDGTWEKKWSRDPVVGQHLRENGMEPGRRRGFFE